MMIWDVKKEASFWLNESLTLFRDLGDRWWEARLIMESGSLASSKGDYHVAAKLLKECLAIYQSLGDSFGVGFSLNLPANAISQTIFNMQFTPKPLIIRSADDLQFMKGYGKDSIKIVSDTVKIQYGFKGICQ